MRIAVIGLGAMGINHARVIKKISLERIEGVELSYVIDIDRNRARKASKLYGGTPLENIDELNVGDIDAAFIATPTSTHYDVAIKLMDKDVGFLFIEKPLTNSIDSAIKLIEEAESRNIVVSVGHIERFNPAVTELLYEIRNGVLGKPLTILSRRVGPFVPRVRDTDVIYDLGIHEIDIHLYILNNYPYQLRAHGLKNIVTTNNLYDHAWITLNYGENLSSIEVNRVTPFKLRKLYLTTREAVAVLDYIDQDLHIYRNKYDVAVRVKREEPLYIEDLLNIIYFLRNKKALVDHYQAFASMLLCEKSIESASKSRELDLENDETYTVYRDYVVKGLSGYRSFINVLEELRDQLL